MLKQSHAINPFSDIQSYFVEIWAILVCGQNGYYLGEGLFDGKNCIFVFKLSFLEKFVILRGEACNRDVDPHWSYANPDIPNLVNVDPDPGQKVKNTFSFRVWT